MHNLNVDLFMNEMEQAGGTEPKTRMTSGRTEIERCPACDTDALGYTEASEYCEYCEYCEGSETLRFQRDDLATDSEECETFAYVVRNDAFPVCWDDLTNFPRLAYTMLCTNCAKVRPDEILFSVVVVDKAILCESCQTYVLPKNHLSPGEFYTAARAAVSQSPNKFIVVDSLGSD